MLFKYNSWDSNHKKPFGAVKSETQVSFCVEADADKVFLLGFGEKLKLEKSGDNFTANVMPNINCGLIHYSFEAHWGSEVHIFGKSPKGGECKLGGESYQLTIHNNSDTPDWFKNKTMYQIYVDRFYKGNSAATKVRDGVLIHSSWDELPVYVKNDAGEIVIWDFFGGNIDGVILKLGYLKSIGVDIIYLNPIFDSSSNHKYDTADYGRVDMMYGNEDTLERLVSEADALGMKIMLDGVFSHTGDDSIYFNKYKNYGEGGAYNDPDSKYFSWYSFEKYPEKYDCWWGVKALPCVNELEPTYMDYLLNEKDGAVIKWMRAGVAGWRLDVADELPDEFISKLKEAILKVNPKAVLLGEVWEDASNKVSYGTQRKYILNNSLNSVSNYPVRDGLIALITGKIGAGEFASSIMKIQENYPRDIFMSLMNMTGTHDTIRLATLLGDAPEPQEMGTWKQREYALPEEKMILAQRRLAVYLAAIFTMPGNPCIYYGDEIMTQGYADPYNRATYSWESKNVETIELIKKLSVLRKKIISNDVFIRFVGGADILAYELCSEKGLFRVFINYTDSQKEVEIGEGETLFLHNADKNSRTLVFKPYGAAVIS